MNWWDFPAPYYKMSDNTEPRACVDHKVRTDPNPLLFATASTSLSSQGSKIFAKINTIRFENVSDQKFYNASPPKVGRVGYLGSTTLAEPLEKLPISRGGMRSGYSLVKDVTSGRSWLSSPSVSKSSLRASLPQPISDVRTIGSAFNATLKSVQPVDRQFSLYYYSLYS